MKQGSYSDVERGRYKVSATILMAMQETFKENPGWIRSGHGDTFTEAVSKIPGREDNDSGQIEVKPIKYYDLEATASLTKIFEAGDKYHPREIEVPGFSDCELAMNVWGNSMEPDFHSGEIILLKPWQENFIEYGQVYLIITKTNHHMLKILYPGDKEKAIKTGNVKPVFNKYTIFKLRKFKLFFQGKL